MVTVVRTIGSPRINAAGKWVYAYEYRGTSTDDKPTNCGNGSEFVEIDTGKLYLFDESAVAWDEWGAS